MKRQKDRTKPCLALSGVLLLAGVTAWGQVSQTRAPAADRRGLFTGMPSSVLPQVAALGSRVQVGGKEQTVYVGEFLDAAGNRTPLQVIHQLPGLVRLVRSGAAAAAFDGAQSYRVRTPTDEAILETFVSDTTEGMLRSVQRGEAVRLLGKGFGADPRRVPDYKGPRYDVYEVAAAVPTRADKAVRIRRYYFDTQSGLLMSTRYHDSTLGPGVSIETRFSNWQVTNGSAYPGRIDRFEDKRLVFSFVVAAVSAAPRQEPDTFR